MAKRAGTTETVSISLRPEPLRILRSRAKRVHGGNLSAAIAEAAETLRLEEARQAVVMSLDDELGPLTEAARHAVDAEWRRARRKRTTKRRAA
jgi:hypothetical protein